MSRFGSLTARLVSSSGQAAQQAEPQSSSAGMYEIVGHLDSVRVFGEWGTGVVWTEDREEVKITGEAVKDLKEGFYYKLAGKDKHHQKYGKSFDVISAMPYVKLDQRAIAKYMEANFEGIGPKSAEKMVKHALDVGGQDGLELLRQQLLNNPWDIDWGPAKREGAYKPPSEDETATAFVHRDLTTRLGNVPGMNAPTLKLLAKWAVGVRSVLPPDDEFEKTADPVADCWRLLTHNPYAPIKDVVGYGFLMADSIGRLVNIPLNSPQRLAALVAHALTRGCEMEGHVYLTERQITESIRQVDRQANPEDAVQFGLSDGTIVLDDERGARRFYTPKLKAAEDAVAAAVVKLMGDGNSLLTDLLGMEDKIQAAFRHGKKDGGKLSLDESQVGAVKSILISKGRIHILTGGPGCGKTALVETIVRMLPGRLFNFGAPTGKAAKVLGNRISSTGNRASTVHSLLRGGEGGWQVNKESPLEGDVVVIDESSMPPVEMYMAILDAVNSNMHLILTGDEKQLQSIQPGRVLADLIEVPGINHVHLTTTHRNSGGILEVVKEIAEGRIDTRDRDGVTFSHGLPDASEYFPVVMQAYVDAVGRRGIENVLLMISRRQGSADEPGWNTTYANAVLRELCNPNAEKLPGTGSLHVGDRIIIRDNMSLQQKPAANEDAEDAREERVVNGDTGTILSFERPPAGSKDKGVAWVRLKLDDGRMIDYPGFALKALDHSYALTVHAVQGSEYAEVIGVFTPGTPNFINNSTLYTGGSRPSLHMHYYAEDQVLRRIAATPVPRRNSALVEKITELLNPAEDEDDALPDLPAPQPSRFRMAA